MDSTQCNEVVTFTTKWKRKKGIRYGMYPEKSSQTNWDYSEWPNNFLICFLGLAGLLTRLTLKMISKNKKRNSYSFLCLLCLLYECIVDDSISFNLSISIHICLRTHVSYVRIVNMIINSLGKIFLHISKFNADIRTGT